EQSDGRERHGKGQQRVVARHCAALGPLALPAIHGSPDSAASQARRLIVRLEKGRIPRIWPGTLARFAGQAKRTGQSEMKLSLRTSLLAGLAAALAAPLPAQDLQP